MDLTEAKLNTNCKIIQMDIENEKVKIRLMELGLNVGTILKVEKKSALKQTLLLVFNNSCFTLKRDIAKFLKINYV